MNFSLFKTHPVVVLIATLCFATLPAVAQKYQVETDEPYFEDFPSPVFDTSVSKRFEPKFWLEMEAMINVEMAPAPKNETCDALTVKWYVAVENSERAGTYFLLTKDINYVNIPLDEDVHTSVYLSPASIQRLLGTTRNAKKAVYLVGYEVLVNGVVQGGASSKGKPGWWNQASSKVSRTDTVPLLSKSETPFRDLWWDRYAEEKTDRR